MKAFEEWFNKNGPNGYADDEQWFEYCKAAYRAGHDKGVTKGMLRAAEIAEEMAKNIDAVHGNPEDITEAIRKEAENGKQ